MVFFNHATRQMTAKIVYYGPGLCGKTTNLNTIYAKTSQKARGEMVSLNTETDRTLFFDLLPMDIGTVGGFKAKLQLYTVPGQVFYNSTRKLVLKGVDGIVFVADSQVPMLDANKDSLQNLEENLKELGMVIGDIPMVFQWNKRDLKNIVPVEQLEVELNPKALPSFQSIASEGTGVFETLRGATKLALAHIKTHHLGEPARPEAPEPVRASVPTPPSVPPPSPAPSQPPPISMPTPARPLDLMDLPSAADILSDVDSAPRSVPAPPKAQAPPPQPVPPQAPLRSSPPPLPAPKVGVAKPATPPKLPSLAPLALPKPKAPTAMAPRSAMGALLNLPMAVPQTVHLDLPAELGNEELELEIRVVQKGQVVAQTKAVRAVPQHGAQLRVSLELKRG